jgi:hypothetical protein
LARTHWDYRQLSGTVLVISVIKTKWMLFGPLPRVLPIIWVGAAPIELVSKYKFVGTWFASTTRQNFATCGQKSACC